jgi:hypothetical protein
MTLIASTLAVNCRISHFAPIRSFQGTWSDSGGVIRRKGESGDPPQTYWWLTCRRKFVGSMACVSSTCLNICHSPLVLGFLVHDLSLSFAILINVSFASSRGGPAFTVPVMLGFRLRTHLGLQLTSVEFHYEHLQLVKCCLLETQTMKQSGKFTKLGERERVSEFTSRWAAPNELEKLKPVVEHDLSLRWSDWPCRSFAFLTLTHKTGMKIFACNLSKDDWSAVVEGQKNCICLKERFARLREWLEKFSLIFDSARICFSTNNLFNSASVRRCSLVFLDPLQWFF